MKRILINHRSSHHAKHSGYDQIAEYLKADCISGLKHPIPYFMAKMISKLYNENAGYYGTGSVFKEIELLKRLFKNTNENTVVHFACAERDFRMSSSYTKRKNKVRTCGTFHKPSSALIEDFTDTKYFKRYDGAIAVSESQVEFLKSWLKIDNVKYIPHGVNTDFFVPDYSKRKPNSLLFVGTHLRDYDTFNRIIKTITNEIPLLKVNVVLPEWARKFITNSANICIHSNINDLELRNLYQESCALILPLKDVTACNAILEAMSCGLPIITNDIGGNRSYLNNTSNILYPNNDESYVLDATLNLLKKEELQMDIGKSSRLKSIEYDWNNVTPKILEFYESLFE